ncbi:hypothetical protein K8Z49_44835 [Actinomadura madurae]|uniref:PspA-associated protein PspAB n=2 Tax=Actinomadura madurae TaxID=1993 RepID=UPI0020273043|nr:hypothetical protein [Actinomadura madurae]MCP9954801.1 hypothetical protein [Actinomadura madurae]MCP9971540.1 hypothetical protein [Actinomadura madurae]MCP9984031.1 hypothetical protein [Actinomadura madurae]URN02438.1 hypothetical protein LUW74_03000 [Actinomadura madurae]
MGIKDGLLGRPAPAAPELDRLFALPAAAPALAAETGFAPAGSGGVCHRMVEGGAFGGFARAQREAVRLLGGGEGHEVGMSAGPYGWGWARVTGPPDGLERLVGDLHTFTATLDAAGYGPYLLCTAVCFHRGDGPQRLFIVHSPVRGTFYPFAPRPPDVPGENRRNNLVEAHARDALAAELPMEPDTARWFPLWDAPGL